MFWCIFTKVSYRRCFQKYLPRASLCGLHSIIPIFCVSFGHPLLCLFPVSLLLSIHLCPFHDQSFLSSEIGTGKFKGMEDSRLALSLSVLYPFPGSTELCEIILARFREWLAETLRHIVHFLGVQKDIWRVNFFSQLCIIWHTHPLISFSTLLANTLFTFYCV